MFRFHRRRPEFALLIALPIVLLAFNPGWIYSRLYHDPWIYFGHMQNLAGHTRAFGDQYPASRLTVTAVGAAVYKLFPPVVANHVLHLGLYYLALGSLYYVVGQSVGRRAGVMTAVACGCHFFFLEAVGWDYSDGFIVAYYLGSLACLTRASVANSWRRWVALGGVLAIAMVIANMVSVILVPSLLLYFGVVNHWRQRVSIVLAASCFFTGAASLTVALGTLNYKIAGQFWFMASQFQFAGSTSVTEVNIWHMDLGAWIGKAYWLVFPSMAAMAAVLRLVRLGIGLDTLPRHRMALAILWHGQLLVGMVGLLTMQIFTQYWFMQMWFYVSYLLMPMAFFSLAEVWSAWLTPMSSRAFGAFTLGLGGALIASATMPSIGQDFGAWGRPAKVATLAAAIGAAGLPFFRMPRGASALLTVVLLAGLNGVCRHEFLVTSGFSAIHHTEGLMAESQALDAFRPQAFRAIHECAALARERAPDTHVYYWFDMTEPLGPVFESASCTQWLHLRFINRAFPSLSAPNHAGLQPGRTILVLSQLPSAGERAVTALNACGVNAQLAGVHSVGRSPIRFTAAIVEIAE
jgi:hypothetical protein